MTLQEVLVDAAETHTVGDIVLPTDEGLNSGGDGNNGPQICSTAPMVDEDYELHPGLEDIPGAHNSFKAAEGQAVSGSHMGGPAAMGYVIDLQVSKPTSPADSEEDAEAEADVDADVDAEEVGNSAFAGPVDER